MFVELVRFKMNFVFEFVFTREGLERKSPEGKEEINRYLCIFCSCREKQTRFKKQSLDSQR